MWIHAVYKLIQPTEIEEAQDSSDEEPSNVARTLSKVLSPTPITITRLCFYTSLEVQQRTFFFFTKRFNHTAVIFRGNNTTQQQKLSHLMLVIIDEISMVGSNMLLEIHKRLQQIKGVSPDITFGGVSILAVGDLYQLPPVGQPEVFSTVSDSYAQL